ncbi:protein FAM83G [Thalassophryne amazonica]|uniref:protein FAM83G n=1 Tax=Thalassophryne amazonica TaxID=390379 RepID=UPI001470A39F|nr:protein FAM83G [Thalassophryne amazonica]XP_034043365.1 protein FAM83G [Thalassophryne amazonica]
MALSQIQCLDDHHVNWRVSESKPEFFYSEHQRLALETLIADGRDAFTDYLRKHGVRPFLSEPELERLERTAEAYRPGHEHHQKPETPGPGNVTPGSWEDVGDAVSLEYWPDRSEESVPELDLGWPEAISYRGVTRVTVYTQPPAPGHTHIKEVVRKSIVSAQKVIAVVMDSFTDVDIFRDLLDASYKRRIPVYIIIDYAAVPCFLSMCGRADMHRGHLKNLRVRCCGGVEFFTRSAQKVRGSLSQKFLLVDGDRAIAGSYSFTWSSFRLDRNLITVITGQAVETLDLQFRELYLLSRSVSLSKVPMEDEPVPDPLPQVAPAPVSAAIARKLINPKYALVAMGTHASLTSSEQNSSNKNSQNPSGPKLLKNRVKDAMEDSHIHPGLLNLEKAYLIAYLPTWPEPDPPSDVIGFINIMDEKRAHKVHLQRSERFEVSQAIHFKSPLMLPSQNEDLFVRHGGKAAGTAEPLSVNTSAEAPVPVSAPDMQVSDHTSTAPKTDNDVTDSRGLPQQPDTHAQKPNEHNAVSAELQLTDQTTPKKTTAPPIPKRRTLQLVIDSTPSTEAVQPQVTLVKMDQFEILDEDISISERPVVVMSPGRGRLQSKDAAQDSGSNGDGSQDSTKVICDKMANDNPSSVSTASEEEFYDCSNPEPNAPLANGINSGSGRGHHQGDGLNMMARISQSMLDLREPSQPEDSAALIRQSQQLRRQGQPPPHRHIGQLFQTSRSPAREARQKGPPKLILSKPGSFRRLGQTAVPVIGGRSYWQSQALQLDSRQPDSSQQHMENRSGRSPRRHSPGYRKTDRSAPQTPTSPSGLLGVPFSKLSNFRHLRSRGGGSQKKAQQTNKDAR